ncbi:uncharacterized protein LOC134845350 isoform X2 [Symsagittifera roscoffensis]|uniref:uncharacterized protein LOC134845350 isoform X2 n=1 Tax=Symsagittifera roscoffensis TaxID=84072 RepID=UPI00307C358A
MNLDASVCAGNRSSTDTPVEEMGSVVNLAAEMAANKRLYSLKMDDGGGGDVHMNMNSVGCKADTNANSTTDGPPPPLHCHSQSHSSFLAMGMGGYEEVAIQTESVDNCEPCETGSHLLLEGVVWHETQDGVLVVNITWRGRSYVGTLLDHTRYDWASGSTSYCDPPEEKRAAKGRNTNNSNSSFLSSFPLPTRRNSSASLANANSVTAANTTTSSTSGGGRTTNNSIAAEYDAHAKLRVQAVSPLVSSSGNNVYSASSGAPAGTIQQTPSGAKGKKGSQATGSRTPPPLTIVEEQQLQYHHNSSLNNGATAGTSNVSATSATGVKRKSEKNCGGGDGQNENKTGKKPRVTITNYGANNETTLTTIISSPMTNVGQDIMWKCSQGSCSKKYKHKNGLRYHITHAHAKSEEEADVLIENEMNKHIAANGATVTTEMVPAAASQDDSFSDSAAVLKMASPSGKSKKGSRKSSTAAKDKKKPRRESEDSTPSSSEQGSNSVSDVDSAIAATTTTIIDSKSEAIAAGSVLINSEVKEEQSSPIQTSSTISPKNKLARNSSLPPLQGNDPSSQPGGRKVAKIAPTAHVGPDAGGKLFEQMKIQTGDGNRKVGCSDVSGNHLNENSVFRNMPHSQLSSFPIQTPMYPFGAVDPKLYTNLVGSQFSPKSDSAINAPSLEGYGSNALSPRSPKPEGTAVRIVHPHSQLMPTGHVNPIVPQHSAPQQQQQWGQHVASGFVGLQLQQPSGAFSGGQTEICAGLRMADNQTHMTKYMETNA